MHEPERIELKGGESVEITWQDGRVDRLSATTLRDACSCAACRTTPPPPADPDTCRIVNIGLVGAYALNMVFAPDGHGTGIYPFTKLRDLGDLRRDDA
jgi:DUF971 family protein